MEMRRLGSSGIGVTAVGLGTWAIGGGPWWGTTNDEQSIRAIHASLDAGINLIDTAPAYGFGHSERIVGRAIRDRRDRVVLATKCGLWWKDGTGSVFFEQSGKTVRRSLDPRTIRIEVEESLRRLGTDRIDLMQTHWQATPDAPTPIADTMACLTQLRAEGKIRAIGVSNATPAQMDEYRAAGDLAACQPRYSMLDRKIEADVLPYCRDQGIAALVYSPLEQGLLTGKIGMDRQFSPEAARNMIPWFRPGNRHRVLDMLARWDDLCEKHACSLAQLVIAWTVAQPGVTCALCGARKPEDAEENAGAGAVHLGPEDAARMRADVEALGEPAA
ncbi:MAG TPA: aldo/keto reductase [Verrucomicrobiae bacterium]|nr:aldo/keto reductase [Verrucomicrobiae bacterium]